MRKIWKDVRYKYDRSTDKYNPVSEEIYLPKLKGKTLAETVKLQGWSLADVWRAIRSLHNLLYSHLLVYGKCRKPMENGCDDLEMWHDIKQACDDLNIYWEGWNDLPNLPDDDF